MAEILLKISTFLLAAILVVPLAKKMRLGSVLGYLIAGILIGPFVFGFLGSDDHTSLRHVSEFGVVMMLFMIGLELKPSFLWRMRVPIIGMGGVQMFLCTLALTALAIWLGQNWKIALAIGMILSISSTALIMQTLSEKALLATRAGRSAFSVLLFQDISVIPLLAILPMLSFFNIQMNDGLEHNPVGQWLLQQASYVRFIAIFGAVAFVVIVGRYAVGRVFRFIATTGMRDIFTATALFLVIGVAYLMQTVGVSAALGTFLAGVMLADSEYRHEIELSLEPFKGLLLGLFFMAVGAGIDFHLLWQNPYKVASLVALLMSIKFVVLFILAKAFHFRRHQALLFACTLAQGGEFAYVLFEFSAQNYIIPMPLTDLLTLVVTLSMLLTPLLMLVYGFIYPRIFSKTNDVINEEAIETYHPVIVAGYGRFNQILGRLLRANGFECTVLDNNPRVIDTLKRFGQKVYYGDATRPDILALAGAEHAQLIVIGFEDSEKTLLVVENVQKHFPHLKIFVRARDRINAFKLMEKKVNGLQRETFLSSLELGKEALIALGLHPHTAHRQARIFKTYDENIQQELYHVWKDDPNLKQGQQAGEQYISKTRALSEALIAVLRSDRFSHNHLNLESDHTWEPLPTETELMEQALRAEMYATREEKRNPQNNEGVGEEDVSA